MSWVPGFSQASVFSPSLNHPHLISLLAFPRSCAILKSDPFSRFSQHSLFPLYGHHFGFCAYFIVLFHYLAPTVYVLSKKNPSDLFWLLLCKRLVKGIPLCHFVTPPPHPQAYYPLGYYKAVFPALLTGGNAVQNDAGYSPG